MNDVQGFSGVAYAVGGGVDDLTLLARRSDAGTWSIEPSPAGAMKPLSSVFAVDAENAWAVGGNGLVVRRTQGGWSLVPAFTLSNLEGVWASSTTDVWAVSSVSGLWHYDGQTWSSTPAPDLDWTMDAYSVWGVSTQDLYVVANFDTHFGTGGSQFDGGYVLHYRRR